MMKWRRGVLCGFIAVIIPAVFISCKKNAPTDLAQLTKFVASQTSKDQVNVLHKTHEKAEVACVTCHHKFENPERIKTCSTCHGGDEKRIAQDLCLKCHIDRNK
jgi:Zn finger protein HypA/HybF involved in hydrogenase expression